MFDGPRGMDVADEARLEWGDCNEWRDSVYWSLWAGFFFPVCPVLQKTSYLCPSIPLSVQPAKFFLPDLCSPVVTLFSLNSFIPSNYLSNTPWIALHHLVFHLASFLYGLNWNHEPCGPSVLVCRWGSAGKQQQKQQWNTMLRSPVWHLMYSLSQGGISRWIIMPAQRLNLCEQNPDLYLWKNKSR